MSLTIYKEADYKFLTGNQPIYLMDKKKIKLDFIKTE